MTTLSCARGIALALATLSAASTTYAQHPGDINPSVVPAGEDLWRIVTSAIGPGGDLVPDARVFPSDFGDSGFPTFTSNPGFDALPDTFLPGTRVGFHAPEGFFRFTGNALEPVSAEALNVKFLTLQVTIDDQPNVGFDLAVQSNGGWHRHFSFTLLATDGEELSPGIFVLPMTLYSTDPAVLESDVFWLVFDYQAPPGAQEAAMAWVEETFLGSPCPADLDGDGNVGPTDLGALLGAWSTGAGPADLDGDGVVGPADLGSLLGAWGACP